MFVIAGEADEPDEGGVPEAQALGRREGTRDRAAPEGPAQEGQPDQVTRGGETAEGDCAAEETGGGGGAAETQQTHVGQGLGESRALREAAN